MNQTKKQKGRKATAEAQPETCCCPFCFSNRVWEEKKDQYSGFFAHLRKARIEVLRGLRTLIDERISSLEQDRRKVTKVKVE